MTEEQARELSVGDEVIIRGTFVRRFEGDLVINVKCTASCGGTTKRLSFAIPEVVSLPNADRKEQNNE